MATEWYLLKSPHVTVSGYESEAQDEFAQEAFLESLETDMACDVELYNYDLSECTPMRAIIQDRVQDTRLKSLNRLILAPIGSLKSGLYVKYKGRFWLIVGLVDDNTLYEKGVMTLCNYKLTWLDDHNNVHQRWANVTTASQYNNGETSTEYMFVRSDQLLILLPDDDDSLLLQQGQRFIIDRRCEVYEKHFDESVTVNTDNPVIVYQLTRSDSVLYDYTDSGHHEIMVYEDEQREYDGYYVIDGKGYWLCDNPFRKPDVQYASAYIDYESTDIYNGLDAGVFIAKFYDIDGHEVSATPNWEVEGDLKNLLMVEEDGGAIYIAANDKRLINKSFLLTLSADGFVSTSVIVSVRAFI